MKTKFEVTNNHFNTRPVAFHHNGRPSLVANMESCTPSKYNKFGFKAAVMDACCEDGKFFKARKESKWLTTYHGEDFQRDWPYPDKCYPAPTPAPLDNNHLNRHVHLFTITNIDEHGSAVRQLRHFGMDVRVLGRNIRSYDHDLKIPLLIKHIPTIETDLTMFFDSDDIWFSSGNLKHLLQTFQKHKKCKMLCNADAWFFPKGSNEITNGAEMQSWMQKVIADEGITTPYTYLNSGLWVAETKFLQEEFLPRLKVLRAAQDLNMYTQTYSDCDQSMFHYVYRDLYPDMQIDSTCSYFQPWNWSPWLEENYKGYNSLTIKEL